MPRFLVGHADSNFEDLEYAIVDCDTHDKALDKYIRHAVIYDDYFTEHVYSRMFNVSFAEKFWLQGAEEVEKFSSAGEVSIDRETFIKRVRTFFAESPDFGDLYIEHYFEDVDDPLFIGKPFPEDMLVYIFHRIEWTSIVAISMDEIKEIK